MHPLLQIVVSYCNHVVCITPVTVYHVPWPVVFVGAYHDHVLSGDVPLTAAAYIPIVEPFEQLESVVCPSLVGVAPSRARGAIRWGRVAVCRLAARVATFTAKSSSAGISSSTWLPPSIPSL